MPKEARQRRLETRRGIRHRCRSPVPYFLHPGETPDGLDFPSQHLVIAREIFNQRLLHRRYRRSP